MSWMSNRSVSGRIIEGILLDQAGGDETLIHFHTRAMLLVKTVNQTNE